MKEFKKVTTATEIIKIYDEAGSHKNKEIWLALMEAEENMQLGEIENGREPFKLYSDDFLFGWVGNLEACLESFPKAQLFYSNRGIRN